MIGLLPEKELGDLLDRIAAAALQIPGTTAEVEWLHTYSHSKDGQSSLDLGAGVEALLVATEAKVNGKAGWQREVVFSKGTQGYVRVRFTLPAP